MVSPLPAEATLASVTIDGNPQIIAVTDGKLKLPLHPGTQTVAIAWKKVESALCIHSVASIRS